MEKKEQLALMLAVNCKIPGTAHSQITHLTSRQHSPVLKDRCYAYNSDSVRSLDCNPWPFNASSVLTLSLQLSSIQSLCQHSSVTLSRLIEKIVVRKHVK